MAVRFVLGRAGTGKSRHCFDAIVKAMRADPLGPAIYWLLPKQATFSAERELVTDSGLTAFCRTRVLSFELLGEEVLAGCGGSAVPQISSIGRQMLIGHLLRSKQDELSFFRGVARQPGLAARLDATFAEFERCGNDPASVADVIGQISQSDDVETQLLSGKLRDFHLLYQAYRDVLGSDRVDPHRRLEQVLSCIGDHAGLRGASVYIDDFREFTDRERKMIVALAKNCASVDITLLIDPHSPTIANIDHIPDAFNLFHHTESEYRLLMLALREAGVVIEPAVKLVEPRRFANDAAKAIERSMFEGRFEPMTAPKSLKLIETPDRRTEVDAVARRINALTRTGLRYRQMAVLVRDIDEYEQLVRASFEEHGIPLFIDRRRSAAHHPLIRLTRAILLIARHRWPHEAVMTLIKSGLACVEPGQADALENYVLLHRIAGDAWTRSEPWTFNRKLTRGREDEESATDPTDESVEMDALRRKLASSLAAFTSEARPVRMIVADLFKVYAALDVRKTLAGWIDTATGSGNLEEAGEHKGVWDALVELFDQMIDLLGDETMELADFMEVLDTGLERFDLALTPPRVDEVLVGQVDRTRIGTLDTVFVMGLSEGQFPKVIREDSVLSDSERTSLEKQNVVLDPASERRQLDERLMGYIAFTAAARRLIVTRAASHEQKPLHPSSYWTRLTQMFPDLPITREQRESEAGPDAIGTPRQLVTALMRWARRDDPHADAEQPWPALYQFLCDHRKFEDPIGVMRYRAWRALSYRNEAKLSPQTAGKLFPLPLVSSVSRFETFATCPFKHFSRYALGLEVREEDDVTSMDLGTIYHGILERVVGKSLADRKDFCDLDPASTRKLIGEFADEIGKTLRGEIMLSSARNQYIMRRIARTLDRVCATQRAGLSRGALRPAFAELGFGFDDESLPALLIETPKGRELKLRGKIDRVDRAANGPAVAVIDYKMRETRLDLDAVYHGLSLQLLTYLLVLDAGGKKLFNTKISPAAAFYARLLRALDPIKHPDDAVDPNEPAFDLQHKPRGIIDLGFLDQIDADFTGGASDVVNVFIKQDGALGRVDSSDAADSESFAALLRFVRKRIAELADRLIDGVIDVRPYRRGTTTPCSHCDYRAVCRFDPAINQYLNLPAMKRSVVLEKVTRGDTHGD